LGCGCHCPRLIVPAFPGPTGADDHAAFFSDTHIIGDPAVLLPHAHLDVTAGGPLLDGDRTQPYHVGENEITRTPRVQRRVSQREVADPRKDTAFLDLVLGNQAVLHVDPATHGPRPLSAFHAWNPM